MKKVYFMNRDHFYLINTELITLNFIMSNCGMQWTVNASKLKNIGVFYFIWLFYRWHSRGRILDESEIFFILKCKY